MTTLKGAGAPAGGNGEGTGPAAARGGRRLSTRATIGVSLMFALAIGGTSASFLRTSIDGMRTQAETAGRHAATTAATAFATLAEPSAANVARTLDIVLDDQLRAQAAATATLVEAAEAAGYGRRYIEDALRQITVRSPIERIDVVGAASYGTEESPLQAAGLEPALRALEDMESPAATASVPARHTETGLTKAAAARTAGGPGVVRIVQALDSLRAAETYGGTGDDTARQVAREQARAIARLTTHAIELGEDAGWGRTRIEARLGALVRNTALRRITAHGAGGRTVYEAGGTALDARPGPGGRSEAGEGTGGDRVGERERYDAQRRWIAYGTASRSNGRLDATVELTTLAGAGRLVDTGWQAEANRLASAPGVTGVWVAAADGAGLRLAAAAPSSGEVGGTDAWPRWSTREQSMARAAAASGRADSAAAIPLLGATPPRVLSAAPAGRGGGSVSVVIETDASETRRQMRREAGTVLGAAGLMIAILSLATTWGARRWLTRPVETMARAAQCLQRGERPPAGLTTALERRSDEIGSLARSFSDMTEEVLARHDELTELVARRTRTLEQTNALLTEAQQQVERELGLAKTVQESLMPDGTRTIGGCVLHWRVTPARELGGDFVIAEPHGEHGVFVAVCDVSGKGVAAALFMAVAQSVVAAAAAGRSDVAAIAAAANERLCRGNTLGMFVTGLICRLDTRSGRFDYVSAGHEPAIVIDGDGGIDEVDRQHSLPLGLVEDERYAAASYDLGRGGCVVGYTDGVTDACDASEAAYGVERLTRLLRDSAAGRPEAMLARLWEDIDAFSGEMPTTDDRTCLVVRRGDA